MPSRPLLGAALLCLLAGAAAHSANPCPSVAAWEGGDLSVIEGEWLVAEFECSKEVFAVDGTSVTWSYLDYDGQKGTSTFNITAPGKFYQGDGAASRPAGGRQLDGGLLHVGAVAVRLPVLHNNGSTSPIYNNGSASPI